MTNSNNTPFQPMQQGSHNSFQVTHSGQTKTVTGANNAADAARQAFGSNGNKATVQQTATKKW